MLDFRCAVNCKENEKKARIVKEIVKIKKYAGITQDGKRKAFTQKKERTKENEKAETTTDIALCVLGVKAVCQVKKGK